MAKQIKIDAFLTEETEEDRQLKEKVGINEEGPYELPEGWKWVQLGRVAEIDKETRNPSIEMPDKEFIYIDISGVEGGTGRIIKVKKILGKNAPSRARRVIHTNDVIMSTVRPYLKSFATIPESYDNQICSTGFAVLSCRESILPKYLLYALFSDNVIHQCNAMMMGAHYPALRTAQVSEIKIPLAPFEEQKRVVARVEELVGRVEEAKRLKRIAREEAEKIMKAALSKIFTPCEEKEWKQVEIGDTMEEVLSGFPRNKSYIDPDGVVHLRPNNIGNDGKMDLTTIIKVRPPEQIDIQTYYLRNGDVLFNNTNSVELVGRAVIVDRDLPFTFSNHITRIRVKRSLILPEWLVFSINHLWQEGYFQKLCRRWIGQAGFNTTMLSSTRIFLPSLEEQKKMVLFLKKIEETTEPLKRLQQRTEEELEELVPTILDRAFRGEL